MKSLLFILLLMACPVSGQDKSAGNLDGVVHYLENVYDAFSKGQYMYLLDDAGKEQAVYDAEAYNKLDSLFKHTESYRKKLETNWGSLKSADAETLKRILANKNKEQVKAELLKWKYNETDLSLTNILTYFDAINDMAHMLGRGYYDEYKELVYLPENYTADVHTMYNKLAEFKHLITWALALHSQRVLEGKY